MADNYVQIATSSLSSVSTITFSSIPATYTDLHIVVAARIGASLDNMNLQLNGDTGSNYSRISSRGNGTNTETMREGPISYMTLDRYSYFGTTESMFRIDINNYASTAMNKTVLARGDNATEGTSFTVGLWRSTAAITSVRLFTGGTWQSGGTATIYGIKLGA